MNDPSIVDFGLTPDRIVQLRRRWPSADARFVALIVHGIGEHSGRYEHVGRFLAADGVDTFAIDLRGFGESGGRRAYVTSFEQYVDDVEDQLAQLRALDLPIVLMGQSMGGLIALSCALSRSPRPDRLVVSAPALGAWIPAVLRLLAPRLARVVPRLRAPAPISGEMLSTDPSVGVAYFGDPLVVRHVTPALGAAFLAQMGWVNAHLQSLSVPTLVLHGADDPLVPTRFSRPLADVASVTRVLYPGLRHEIYNEPQYERVLTDVVDWLTAPQP